MANSATIVIRDLDGKGRTDIVTVALRRKDDNFSTDYKIATPISGKPGVYQFTDVPFNKYKLWINGSEEESFGGTHGRWWPISDLTETFLPLTGGQMQGNIDMANNRIVNVADPVNGTEVGNRDYNDNRYVDKTSIQSVPGEKTFNNIKIDVGNKDINDPGFIIKSHSNPPNGGVIGLKAGYQPNNKMLFDFGESEVKVNTPSQNDHVVNKNYVDNNFIDKTSIQGVPGEKIFYNIKIDVGDKDINNPRFIIKSYSNPPNGGVIGLKAGYQPNNKMLFDFGESEVKVENINIDTSSSKYINGNPNANDYIWSKWVEDNFSPKIDSNTVIVDPNITNNLRLKIYKTLSSAIGEIIEFGNPSENNIWTIYVRQPKIGRYEEDLILSDYINIIGEGQIKFLGNLIYNWNSIIKLENILLKKTTTDPLNLNKLKCTNCIFINYGNIELLNSIYQNCGFFSNNLIQSQDNNKIINCFGNNNINWQSNDNVFRYDYILGSIYE